MSQCRSGTIFERFSLGVQANGSQYVYTGKVETIQECVIRDYTVYNGCGCELEGATTNPNQRPSEHASLDIFNTAYLWEFGPKGHG